MTSIISHECRDKFKHESCNDPACQCPHHTQDSAPADFPSRG